MSSSASASASATSASSTSSDGSVSVSSNLKIVGITLAVLSGLLIGSSFVFKKKGLLRSQAGGMAGEGVAYLKSPLWWLGMTMMIMGELCNFAAYAFVEAVVVTPLGALSVVVCAILSSFFLKEKLSFFGWLGCGLCILGSTIIAFNGPSENSTGEIRKFEKLFISAGFLVYISVLFVAAFAIIFYFGPKYGKKSMLWYIMVCSMIGGISVSVTSGLGAAIVVTAQGNNQFNYWFIYFLFVFVAVTLIMEVYYLNMALALFNTAMVTPTYYVIFTFFSMVTTVVLYQGLSASVSQISTLVLAFLVICCGITILQMSKVDPKEFGNKLDRRSTMLLQAARSQTALMEEKDLSGVEDPGMDSIRGSFGPLGSIIRARTAKRLSTTSTSANSFRSRYSRNAESQYDGLQRHQLYDAPVPRLPTGDSQRSATFTSPSSSPLPPRSSTIKFDTEDLVHKYPTTKGSGTQLAVHERRDNAYRSASPSAMSMDPMAPISEEPSLASRSTTSFSVSSAASLKHPRPQHAVSSGLPPLDPYDSSDALRTAPANMFSSHAESFEQDSFRGPATAGPGTGSQHFTVPMPSQSRFSMSPPPNLAVETSYGDSRSRPRQHKRASSGRGYPRGADDREESVSLVREPSVDESSSPSEEEDLHQRGGIRLVGGDTGTGSSNRF